MTYSVTNRAVMSFDGGSASGAATYQVASPVTNGSSWQGMAGMGMQAGGSLISGFAQIEQANEMSKQASKELAFTETQIYDSYSQLFEEMGDKNRRLYASQDVAVGASGLAAGSGSVMAVLDEAVSVAKKEKDRLNTRMQSEIAAARYRARQIKKQARRTKKYATISTALQIGGMMMGAG